MFEITRREFLKDLAITGAMIGTSSILPISSVDGQETTTNVSNEKVDLVVAEKGEPSALVQSALSAFGGIERFVKKGDYVVIKPNIAWARTPAQACNTNPDIVATIVKLCIEAGAGKVEVWDHTCDEFRLCLNLSGIKSASEKAGAKVFSGHLEQDYREVELPLAKSLKKAKVLKSVLDCNVLINVPVAKVHESTGYTFSMKNWIGVVWSMSGVHTTPLGLHQGIADICTLIKPTLIITDAIKCLVTNGPKGPGKLLDVGKVIVGTDQVAMDSFCATLFGKKGSDILFVRYGNSMGLGEMDLNKISVKTVTA